MKERQELIKKIELMQRSMNVVVYDKRTPLEILEGLIVVLEELPWSNQAELPFPEEIESVSTQV